MVATTRRRVALIGKMATGPNSLGHSCSSSAGSAVVRLDVGQHERGVVGRSLERHVQEMANGAVRAIAADDERRLEL